MQRRFKKLNKEFEIPGPNIWGKEPVTVNVRGIYKLSEEKNYLSILKSKDVETI